MSSTIIDSLNLPFKNQRLRILDITKTLGNMTSLVAKLSAGLIIPALLATQSIAQFDSAPADSFDSDSLSAPLTDSLVEAPFTPAFNNQGLSSALEQNSFLRVTEAFVPAMRWNQDQQPSLDWYIEPGYYLYRARFVLQTQAGDEVQADFPQGIEKFDEFFQENLEVYYNNLSLGLDLPEQSESLYVQFQGCAEAGYCYPPAWVGFDLDLATGSAGYMGELPAGPPSLSATSSEVSLSAQGQPDEDDGLPITLLIGCFSGLFVLAIAMFFGLRQRK